MIPRKNPFCVISIEADEKGRHNIQTNSHWTENPYDDYVVVPDEMVQDIIETKGYCDFETKDEDIKETKIVKKTKIVDGKEIEFPELVEEIIGTHKVVSTWIAGTIPEIEETVPAVSEMEQLRADVDYIAIMTGVDL